MLNLVGDYGSSSDEEEELDDKQQKKTTTTTTTTTTMLPSASALFESSVSGVGTMGSGGIKPGASVGGQQRCERNREEQTVFLEECFECLRLLEEDWLFLFVFFSKKCLADEKK